MLMESAITLLAGTLMDDGEGSIRHANNVYFISNIPIFDS